MTVTTNIYNIKNKSQEPKTSKTHPLNISWIIPPVLQGSQMPKEHSLHNYIEQNVKEKLESSSAPKGNVCLSSCPGKKIRLTRPVRGRASIDRDLELDLSRIQSFGIKMIVCCLDDYELAFLGVSWSKYEAAAAERSIDIYRLPMTDGGCPNSMEVVKKAIDAINNTVKEGSHVLVHCRGGVGRAGLVASCWLLENLFCQTAEKAISIVREQRSAKAIETLKQADYVIRYSIAMRQRQGLQNPKMAQRRPKLKKTDQRFSTPSINTIAQLEYDIMKA
ncbi:hypothetical protein CU098_007187 [Rhizopus stolonifer]|uniref:Tyrosine specific protein phosphatases domain-containing protein n=1 Tax=Rhizopus stolonifer TaxID=4846 RepID=A0A367KVU9_RHIST|nr:hypothetical protein CU098_007187 [Rhizopus stolonifer]